MANTFYERKIICRDCGQNQRQTAHLPLNETGEDMVKDQVRSFRHSHRGPHTPSVGFTPWVEYVDPIEAARRAAGGTSR